MAAITIPGGVLLPPVYINGLTSLTISGVDRKTGQILIVTRTGNIRKIHWATQTVTTGATIDVRVETVDGTTGFPSGTLWGTNTNASVVVNAADDNTFFTTTLTADAAVTVGDLIAIVIAQPSASAGNMQVQGTTSNAGGSGFNASVPYGLAHNGTTWAANQSWLMGLCLEYDDATVEPLGDIIPPMTVSTNVSLNTGTTPDVWGLRFSMPLSCTCTGAWAFVDGDGDFKLMLVSTAYNQGAGTGILASVTFDKDNRRNAAAGMYFASWAAVTLTASTFYRLVVEPTTATTVTTQFSNASGLLGLAGYPGGSNFCLSEAKDPTGNASWTDYNSGTFRKPGMGVQIGAFDNASGTLASAYAFAG